MKTIYKIILFLFILNTMQLKGMPYKHEIFYTELKFNIKRLKPELSEEEKKETIEKLYNASRKLLIRKIKYPEVFDLIMEKIKNSKETFGKKIFLTIIFPTISKSFAENIRAHFLGGIIYLCDIIKKINNDFSDLSYLIKIIN